VRRYRFRLESVLRVRRLQEDVARGALTQATAAVTAAETRLADARAWLRALAAEPMPPDPVAWEARRQIQLGAADAIHARVIDVNEAVTERHSRRVALSEARTRVRALERLDERRRSEHALDNQRAEERTVDDLVTSRFRPAQDPVREAGDRSGPVERHARGGRP
jgi:flagellar FliJ protein